MKASIGLHSAQYSAVLSHNISPAPGPAVAAAAAVGHHDLVDKIDDGPGGLLGIVLRKQMTLIDLRPPARFSRHEAKDAAGDALVAVVPPVLGIDAAEGHRGHGDVAPEEPLPRQVRKSDALSGDLEVDEQRRGERGGVRRRQQVGDAEASRPL